MLAPQPDVGYEEVVLALGRRATITDYVAAYFWHDYNDY